MNIWYVIAAVLYLSACCFFFGVGAEDLFEKSKNDPFIVRFIALVLCFIFYPVVWVWFFVTCFIDNFKKHRNKNKKVLVKKNDAVVFVRKHLGLKAHEHFRFSNQKTDDVYFFDDLELHKIECGLLKRSKISFNYITGRHCRIVKLSNEEFQAYMSQYYKGGNEQCPPLN